MNKPCPPQPCFKEKLKQFQANRIKAYELEVKLLIEKKRAEAFEEQWETFRNSFREMGKIACSED